MDADGADADAAGGLGAGAASDAQSAENDSQGLGGGTHGGGEGADLGAEPGGPSQTTEGGYGFDDFGSDAASLAHAEEAYGIPSAGSMAVGAAIAASQGTMAGLAQADTLGNAIGAAAVGVAGATVGQAVSNATTSAGISLGLAIGLSPTSAVALGVIGGLMAGYKAGQVTRDAVAKGFSEVSQSLSEDETAIGESDSQALRDFFEGKSESEIAEALTSAYEDVAVNNVSTLYRRRSNIIGTGINGLTIE